MKAKISFMSVFFSISFSLTAKVHFNFFRKVKYHNALCKATAALVLKLLKKSNFLIIQSKYQILGSFSTIIIIKRSIYIIENKDYILFI